jgi:hypothetical protein
LDYHFDSFKNAKISMPLYTGGKKGFGRGWQLPLVAVAQPRPKLRD